MLGGRHTNIERIAEALPPPPPPRRIDVIPVVAAISTRERFDALNGETVEARPANSRTFQNHNGFARCATTKNGSKRFTVRPRMHVGHTSLVRCIPSRHLSRPH
jgi:hypothetical protein